MTISIDDYANGIVLSTNSTRDAFLSAEQARYLADRLNESADRLDARKGITK
jgi:hypothetical protein